MFDFFLKNKKKFPALLGKPKHIRKHSTIMYIFENISPTSPIFEYMYQKVVIHPIEKHLLYHHNTKIFVSPISTIKYDRNEIQSYKSVLCAQ